MSRTSKFIINSFSTALFQLIKMITGFILPKIMLSVYGSEINGLVNSILQLISYLALVEAGLTGATIYSLYKPLTISDTKRINSILTAARKFYNRTGCLFMGMILVAAFIYPVFIKTQIMNYNEIVILFFILGFNEVLDFFILAKYRTLLTADQNIYIISVTNIIQTILNVIIIASASYLGASIIIVYLLALLSIIIKTVILLIYCKKKYCYLDFSVEPDYSALNKRWDALYMQIIGVIHNGAPVLISSFLLSLNHVSIYSVYRLVVFSINSILGIFTNSMSSGFGDILARDEKDNFKKSFTEFEYIYYIIITIAFSVMIITFIPFINVYTKGLDINYSFLSTAILMSLNGFFYNIKTPYGMLTISSGKYKESRLQISIQGFLAIFWEIILGIKWGLNGIIVGELISNLYRDIDFIFFAPKHLTHYSFKHTLKMWLRSLFAILVTLSINFVIHIEPVSTYFDWIKLAFIVGIYTTIFTLIINIITDYGLFKQVLLRFKNILCHK